MCKDKIILDIRKACIFTATLLVAVLVFFLGMTENSASAAEKGKGLAVSSRDKIALRLKNSDKYYKYKSKGLANTSGNKAADTGKDSDNGSDSSKDSGSDAKWNDSYTMADLRLMSSIIYCEAGSMGEDARIAVANVIINRANDIKNWGHVSTISEVIYDTKWGVQFSPINGSLDTALELYDNLEDYKGDWKYDQMKNCIDSAKKAFSGEKVIPDSYMYFNGNLESSKEKCEKDGRGYVVIDHHIYFE